MEHQENNHISFSKYSSPFLVFVSLISLLPPPGLCNQAVFKKLILQAVKCQVAPSVPSKPCGRGKHLAFFSLCSSSQIRVISAYQPWGIPIDFYFQRLTFTYHPPAPFAQILSLLYCKISPTKPQDFPAKGRFLQGKQHSYIPSCVSEQPEASVSPWQHWDNKCLRQLTALVKEISAPSFTKLLCHKLDIQGKLL